MVLGEEDVVNGRFSIINAIMVEGWIRNGICCLLLLVTCSGQERSTKHSNLTQVRLLDTLLDGYKRDLRPVKNWKNGTTVYIDITVYSIFAVDEKDQLMSMYCLYNRYWIDEFLRWDPLEYDNITLISLPSSTVWVPDVLIAEFVDSEITSNRNFVYINYTGLVNYQKPIRMSSICIFYIYFFPFDQHNCTLTFQSQLHTIEHINVSMWRKSEDMEKDLKKFYNKGEWELLSINSSHKEVDELGDKFGMVEFYIIFRRHPLYYVVNLIIPSAFLMIMDTIGFYLPPESGERISFKITLLLGYSVFLIIVSETLPASAQGTPIIEVYFVVCMALLVISLTESIFVVRIVSKKNTQSKVPKWIKKLVLENMTLLLRMKDKGCYFQPNNSSDTLQMTETPSTDELSKYCKNGENFRLSPATVSNKENSEILKNILNEIVALRRHLEKDDNQETAKEWLTVGYVLDKFLFWVYLLTILTYIISLSICWSYHYM
ncbi:5-hydroxytryptamine receptor 3A-like isoform X2 [Dendropsophus ebraccatus]|uniref:5-hydroxytryptamine receptor 3A-like isoform X2 n=1 Tax=Dendropsophus ebraccatus TaxID=150705 RepID=UPI0038318335